MRFNDDTLAKTQELGMPHHKKPLAGIVGGIGMERDLIKGHGRWRATLSHRGI
jgi:hypothetical protein